MKQKAMIILFACCIFTIGLFLFACQSKGKNNLSDTFGEPSTDGTIEDAAQSEYAKNVALIQSVDGFSEQQARSLSDLLQYLVSDLGTVPNGKITFAEKTIRQTTDGRGNPANEVYLHFITEDSKNYYAYISKDAFVHIIYKDSLESDETVWCVIQ